MVVGGFSVGGRLWFGVRRWCIMDFFGRVRVGMTVCGVGVELEWSWGGVWSWSWSVVGVGEGVVGLDV